MRSATPLSLAGPGLRAGPASDTPMGNTDIAPTLMALLGIASPEDCDGRVLTEAMADGAFEPQVVRQRVSAEHQGRRQTMPTSTVDGVTYVDSVNVERI